MRPSKWLTVCLISALPIPSFATLPTAGQATGFAAPTGIQEACIQLPPIPGGTYSQKDIEKQTKLCQIDLHDKYTFLCPKVWSTSPATILMMSKGEITVGQFEPDTCPKKKADRRYKAFAKKLGKIKTTMSQSGTSAAFSKASLMYYHLSRYLDTEVNVPVAVVRTMDKNEHYRRVSGPAVGNGTMNINAWNIMKAIELDFNSPLNQNKVELFTPDRAQIWGAMLRDEGERYGAEFNGFRDGGTKPILDGNNNSIGGAIASQQIDFQATAPFLALRDPSPFSTAIAQGEALARQTQSSKGETMNRALGPQPIPPAQMAFWMQELTEIMILDYIFSQQDRVGNIDYEWVWYYREGDEIKTAKVPDVQLQVGNELYNLDELSRPNIALILKQVPAEIKDKQPVLIQRTHLGDNDAGGRYEYANPTKKAMMLEKVRHLNANTYRKLMALYSDLKTQGPVFQYFKSTFNLDSKQLNQVIGNTTQVATILYNACKAGRIRFDLDPKKVLLGEVAETSVSCDP